MRDALLLCLPCSPDSTGGMCSGVMAMMDLMLTHMLALVPDPGREANRVPLQRLEERHRSRPRPPPSRLLKGSGQGPDPRGSLGCARAVVQQGGREENHSGRRCRGAGGVSRMMMMRGMERVCDHIGFRHAYVRGCWPELIQK